MRRNAMSGKYGYRFDASFTIRTKSDHKRFVNTFILHVFGFTQSSISLHVYMFCDMIVTYRLRSGVDEMNSPPKMLIADNRGLSTYYTQYHTSEISCINEIA